MAKIMNFIQSWSSEGKELEPVFTYGATDIADEGIVGHDIRCRPVRLGKGEYTFVCSPDQLEELP